MQIFLAVALLLANELSRVPEPTAPAPIRALIVSGANNHDWAWTSKSLESILIESGKFAVEVTHDAPRSLADSAALAKFQVLVLDYNGPRWGSAAEASFLAAVRGGVGVVVIHAANNAFEGWTEYETLVGDLWREGTGHGAFHRFDVRVTDRDHPITRDLADLVAHPDELYHDLWRAPATNMKALAVASASKESGGTGEDEPMLWVGSFGKGRVFHTPLGHVWPGTEATRVSQGDPQFRELVVRGAEWAATGQVTPQVRAPNTLTPAERAAGWRSVFDGRTGTGWRAFRQKSFPAQGWSVVDGALAHGKGGGGGDLVLERELGNFELELEWKVASGANSGLIYRVSEDRDQTWYTGPEYQVLDNEATQPDEKHAAGALYDLVAAPMKIPAPAGHWNRARISVHEWFVEHSMNGARLLGVDLASESGRALIAASKFGPMEGFARNARGLIALQDHGDEVAYRNIRVREFARGAPISLLDGKSLAGWVPVLPSGGKAEDVWSFDAEGNLICKGNPVGYLRTAADYTNFELHLEWRFSPVTKQAGNSGVLLRLIGPDKVWPRSIEAQLQSGSAGDFWNIDSVPMGTASERTNGRNTKRTSTNEKPIGEWNSYDITVEGPHVVLRVNGVELNRAWGCLEVPGKIGLQSEGAEIHFRNVRLIPLEPAR